MCGGGVTKHKEHKCRFAVVLYWEELDVTEYVADLIAFGSYLFFCSLTLTEQG